MTTPNDAPHNTDPQPPKTPPLEVAYDNLKTTLTLTIGAYTPTAQSLLVGSLDAWIRDLRAMQRRGEKGFPQC